MTASPALWKAQKDSSFRPDPGDPLVARHGRQGRDQRDELPPRDIEGEGYPAVSVGVGEDEVDRGIARAACEKETEEIYQISRIFLIRRFFHHH